LSPFTYQKHGSRTRVYCSRSCKAKAEHAIRPKYGSRCLSLTCGNCKETFTRKPSQHKRDNTKNAFCSRSCSVSYQNTHKTKGFRRSKLEQWIEAQLRVIFPQLVIKACERDLLEGLEFDLYFPDLALAIEFNGIFHYKPIHGLQRLATIQERDKRKVLACITKSIDLWVVDTSTYAYFKPATAQEFLDRCIQLIENKKESQRVVETLTPD